MYRGMFRQCMIFLCVLGFLRAGAAESAWAQSGSVDHTPFDRLLREHVTDEGLVDYDAFARAPEFREYLDALARADVPSLSRSAQLALWINAYNAYTIALINEHEERESIRDINRSLPFLPGKPWSLPVAQVGGRTYTLDGIEHEIIRKQFGEPRIHFALVCAALGCPPLRREAYTGTELDAQLDDQARRFLLIAPAKNRVDVNARRVYLSPIFDWFEEDFGGSDQAVGRYIARFFPAGPEKELLRSGNFRISHTDYDWELNSQGGE